MLHALFDPLAAFTPVLAGTFPLGLNVATSDLDVLCEVHDVAAFEATVRAAFGQRPGFAFSRVVGAEPEAWLASFDFEGTHVELFGQPVPPCEQMAHRHLVVEARLLRLGGAWLRERVRSLKRSGVKTEPAFATVLRLNGGDGYAEVLALEACSDKELASLLTRAGRGEGGGR